MLPEICLRIHVNYVCKLGKNLLLPGEKTFLEAVALALFVWEGFTCPLGAIAAVENDGSVVDNAGEHEHGKVQALLAAEGLDRGLDLGTLLADLLRRCDNDLRDREIAVADAVNLHILIQHLRVGLTCRIRSHGEHVARKFIYVEVRHRRKDIGGLAILLRRRRGMEVHRVREQRAEKKTREVLGHRNLILAEDRRDDSRGRSDDLVSERDRLRGREVIDYVMIDDIKNSCLLDRPY